MSSTLQLSAQSPSITTKSKQPGKIVSDNPTMKAWLAKMPSAFREIKAQNTEVKITNIDVKWKQTKTVRVIAKPRRKVQTNKTYTCTLRLTIEYQDSTSGEESPDLVSTPTPITVNSQCETFLAMNNLIAPLDSDPNT